MKQLLLILSCLLITDTCSGCQKPKALNNRFKKQTVIAQQAMPYKYYELHDLNRTQFLPIMDSPTPIRDCPVPPTPPISPANSPVEEVN